MVVVRSITRFTIWLADGLTVILVSILLPWFYKMMTTSMSRQLLDDQNDEVAVVNLSYFEEERKPSNHALCTKQNRSTARRNWMMDMTLHQRLRPSSPTASSPKDTVVCAREL